MAQAGRGRGVPEGPDLGRPGGDDELESELAAICSIDHFDWLAVITALAEGGPGTAASAADLAAYVRDYDPEDPDNADDLDDSLDEDRRRRRGLVPLRGR